MSPRLTPLRFVLVYYNRHMAGASFVCMFVCLFVDIKPDNHYFASGPGLEVNFNYIRNACAWCFFWFDFFLVCYAATQLALQLQQERIQVVRSTKAVRRIPIESNSTLALFVCLFIVITENPYFTSRLGLEVKFLGVYPLGPRSSSCSPTKGTGTPPPRTTLQTI